MSSRSRFAAGRGLGDKCKNFPDGEVCFCRFPSCGNTGGEPGESIGRRVEGRRSLLPWVYCFGYGFQSKMPGLPSG